MRISLFTVFYCFLLAYGASAQNLQLSEPISLRNDYGYELIGRVKDRILLFRDRYDDFEIQAYDGQMRLSWNKKLEDMDRRGTEIITAVAGKNDFAIIFRYKNRGVTCIKVHKYDPAANLIDSMTIKNFGERIFSPPVLDIVRSEDRNCFVVYNTAERDKVECVCFRLDKMQVLWDKIAIYQRDQDVSPVKTMTLSNSGDLYLVTEFDNRRSKMEEHRYHILRISPDTDYVHDIPIPTVLVSDAKFIFDNKHQCLVAAGLYSDKTRDRAKGSFFLRINQSSRSDTTHSIIYTPFDDHFISILRRKDVEEDTKGITDGDVTQLILREDGGVLLVAERHYEIQRGSSVGSRGFMRDGARLIVDFYYDDLFVIAMEPDGKVQWKTVLHKKQFSQDDDAIFSSYFLLRDPYKLHFFFNDEIKYENTCSEYLLTPLGEFDRNSLLTTFNQNLRLRFRDAVQISTTECLVPSEFRSKLRLLLVRM